MKRSGKKWKEVERSGKKRKEVERSGKKWKEVKVLVVIFQPEYMYLARPPHPYRSGAASVSPSGANVGGEKNSSRDAWPLYGTVDAFGS